MATSLPERLREVRPDRITRFLGRKAQVRLARAGYLVTKADEDTMRYLVTSFDDSVALPPGTANTLRLDNPRLDELRGAYDALDHPASVLTQWNEAFLAQDLSLEWFRCDNPFVWQQRAVTDSYKSRTYLSLLDVESRDRLRLLDSLSEDGLFGAHTFSFGDRGLVSRDLIDSVNEIEYLNAQTGLADMAAPRILDISAGYGRLAHRMSAALPQLATYDCTDAVPISTFLCEFYVDFRQMPKSVRVVPLHEVDTLADEYDIAVNVHSFSECSHAAVRWWLDRIAERRIEWLLIVPNTPGQLLSTDEGRRHEDFMPDVLNAGYELVDHRPVYGSDEMRDMIGINDEFFLFRKTR